VQMKTRSKAELASCSNGQILSSSWYGCLQNWLNLYALIRFKALYS